MTRLLPFVLLCLALAAALPAQEPPKPDPKDRAEEPAGTKPDLSAFVKRQYPGLDPAGEHDFTRLKNYTDGAKRFEYTRAMARLLIFYIKKCAMGAMLAKYFDSLSRTEAANQPTYNALHAVVLLSYPPERPNILDAEKLMRAAVRLDPAYEYPYYLLAELEFARMMQGNSTRRAVEDLLDKANARPGFSDAIALQARVLLAITPPNKAEARKHVEKLFMLPPEDPSGFQDMLGLYANCTSVADLMERVDAAAKAGQWTKRYEAQAHAFVAIGMISGKELGAATTRLEKALSMVSATEDPESVSEWRFGLGATYATLAVDLRNQDPKLYGENRKLFEKYVTAARLNFELGAEIEREHLPVDMRGPGAFRYTQFLAEQIGEMEEASDWLAKYLDRTTLTSEMRTRLMNWLRAIRAGKGNEERPRIELLDGARKTENDAMLVSRLDAEVLAVKERGLHFKNGESQQFFIELMGHQSRDVAGLAAFLLADTAMQRKPEDIELAANAIAGRLENETELVSREQALFQQQLVNALMLFDKRAIDLRAAKRVRKILADTGGGYPEEAAQLIREFSREDWAQKVFGDRNKTLPSRELLYLNVKVLTKWFDEAIAALEKLEKDK